MPRFGSASLAQLATVDPRLQQVLNDAIQYVDFSIVQGHRTKEEQELDFQKGLTKLHWPNGNHNAIPSRAADFSPYPADWSDKTTAIVRFSFVAGVIHQSAQRLGIKIRFGWDWNRNLDPRDETFLDWDHVELDT